MAKIPSDLPWQPTGKTLGQGGQGSVYEVVSKVDPDGPRYAMKILSNTASAQAVSRFIREIDALKMLTHPAVVPIVGHSHPGDAFHYFVMDRVPDARPLHQVIQGSENPFRGNALAALGLFEQLCDVLAACHKQNIIHRDLKPANILLTPDQRLHLIDFGICQIEGHETITLLDEGVGTQNYMAPECEAGNEGLVGPSSDLYSAAKVLWSAVTGKKAFARESPAFTSSSLPTLFPDTVNLWHLQLLFEQTIRNDPHYRCKSADEAVKLARRINYLIEAGYPPLEFLRERCSTCGMGKMKEFSEDYMIFGNSHPHGFEKLKCDYCGYCVVFDGNQLNQKLQERKQLS